jgi:hypothetical protein
MFVALSLTGAAAPLFVWNTYGRVWQLHPRPPSDVTEYEMSSACHNMGTPSFLFAGQSLWHFAPPYFPSAASCRAERSN